MTPPPASPLVIVDYNEILQESGTLNELIEKAYGPRGVGILAIRNVPKFVECKERLFPLVHKLSKLSKEKLAELEDPSTLFNAGWSHGKEKINGSPDFSKGSFYFNPLSDLPGTQEDRRRFPLSYPLNRWPREEDIPTFKHEAVFLGKVMHGVVVELSRHVDAFVRTKQSHYKPQTLYDTMKSTDKAKGRLLYYFPLKQNTSIVEEDLIWADWHNDSGFLTALAGEMYFDDEKGEIILTQDPESGLYVVNRDGQVELIKIPHNCMAVQLGECVQIITGGAVVATPHCVKGSRKKNSAGVSRVSFPCFIDTAPTFPLKLPQGASKEGVVNASLSSKVASLDGRFEDGVTFGDFLTMTFQKYYDD